MSIEIATLRADIPIDLPPKQRRRLGHEPTVGLEIYSNGFRLWDTATYTDCGELYGFDHTDVDGLRARHVGEIPFFAEVFRHLAEAHAANRANPVGEFLRPTVEAMETALARKEGSSVYFAEAGCRIKIGWSKKVATRLAALQTGNAEPIKLLGTMPGGRAKELEIQHQFAHCRVSGEWFEATPDLLAYIGSAT